MRNYRTGLLPRIAGIEALHRIGMHDLDGWEPPGGDPIDPAPVQPRALAPAPKRLYQCRVTWVRKPAIALVLPGTA